MAKKSTDDAVGTKYSVTTSAKTSRKYPHVIWFPRSKTDPQEIREVLKQALEVQNNNPENFFNDKILGQHMATVGSINVVGMQGAEYVEAYQDKSIGNNSYITNARMLMRLFRFFGLVTRIDKGKYIVTPAGKVYCNFHGDFPSQVNGESEEQMLLQALGSFAFYSVNDDPIYRDSSFQVRPFISLLNNLAIEPQCIYQLIVTAFGSKKENGSELERINTLLSNLRDGTTTLEEEFERLGLDANDYSCVHNFYDSAKILVYIGSSLGLIERSSNPAYGKKIAGKARHLKQATTFYKLTPKGKQYLEEQLKKQLIFYSDIHSILGDDSALQGAFVLSALNFIIGSKKIEAIKTTLLESLLGENWLHYVEVVRDKLQLDILVDEQWVKLNSEISFNFNQSIPPEILYGTKLNEWYQALMVEFEAESSSLVKVKMDTVNSEFAGEVVSKFILNQESGIYYQIPVMTTEEIDSYLKYQGKDNIFGGQDRFASRVSPTNSLLVVGELIHVDNETDALDLLAPLRKPDPALKLFINANIVDLVREFLKKSDSWSKDQHYTWIRNCFRQFGCRAIYSGSGGMLSRADVSVIQPFIAGIEAKSPSENRGSINTKAIRQAVDAKVQVSHKFPDNKDLPKSAMAIGRRITNLAIDEELKWRNEGQPVLLVSDAVLYYLSLKSIDLKLDEDELIQLFVHNAGVLTSKMLLETFRTISESKGESSFRATDMERELRHIEESFGETLENVC